MPRVSFGNGWIDDSVLEIFQEDISRFRVLVNTAVEEDPFQALAAGRPPSLKALRLHNGTVYRWNRVCYGVSDGEPHIRIENRVLPSGPTVIDEMANAAFWFGVVSGLVETYPDIRDRMEFDDAKNNFVSAARQGIGADFTWLDGRECSARDLILSELVPMARDSLKKSGLNADDIDRYLGVIEERVDQRRPGSKWILESFSRLRTERAVSESLSAVTAATIARQELGVPVHHWTLAEVEEGAAWEHNFRTVGQFMSTDLVTVNQDELIDMVASVMDWKRLRHVPVEDDEDQLVGMVTYRILLRYFTGRDMPNEGDSPPVSTIMDRNVITVSQDMLTLDAIELMRDNQLTCLPVVHEGSLVGIITAADFLEISRELLRETLSVQASQTKTATDS
jgi:CBS domain-containing protein